MESPVLIDESGPIRYDWHEIKLLFVAGAGVTDIARSITKDQPELLDRVSNTIQQRCGRDEWAKLRADAISLIQERPPTSKNNSTVIERLASPNVIQMAQNIFAARKHSYLERTSLFGDQASKRLVETEVQSLEEASLKAKLFEPVHNMMKTVHGLDAKEGSTNLQVNVLSDWAGKYPSVE